MSSERGNLHQSYIEDACSRNADTLLPIRKIYSYITYFFFFFYTFASVRTAIKYVSFYPSSLSKLQNYIDVMLGLKRNTLQALVFAGRMDFLF